MYLVTDMSVPKARLSNSRGHTFNHRDSVPLRDLFIHLTRIHWELWCASTVQCVRAKQWTTQRSSPSSSPHGWESGKWKKWEHVYLWPSWPSTYNFWLLVSPEHFYRTRNLSFKIRDCLLCRAEKSPLELSHTLIFSTFILRIWPVLSMI